VLNDVSFRARPGEFIALIGPSGSGKSTCLRLTLGFERPASGSIYFDGQDLASLAIQAVRNGQSLANAMELNKLTTPVASRMLRVGERSGNMGEMTERIAAFYDEELSRWVAIVTRLIEPVLMTLIGLLIGVIVVLMYFPIFQLAGSIQ